MFFTIQLLTTSIITSLFLSLVGPAHALSLLQAYELATLQDPTFQAARAAHAAGRENAAIGRAALMPQVSLTYQNAPWNQQHLRHEVMGRPPQEAVVNHSGYITSLTLTQPLFDAAAWASWKQGRAYASMADTQYRAAVHSLTLRVFRAYTDVLFAQDRVVLARAQRDVILEQLQRNRHAFKLGDSTLVDLTETEARLHLMQVSLIDAQDDADVAWQVLMHIIGFPGRPQETLSSLQPDLVEDIVQGLQTHEFKYWRDFAMTQNADLEYQRQLVEIARYEVSRQRAGHFPTVRLLMQHSRSKSETSSAYYQGHRNSTVGITVNIPLYGGGAWAASRQADNNLRNALHTLDGRMSEVILDLKRQYRLSVSGPARINASLQAVRAAETALEGSKRGLEAGDRINLDVLNAVEQLFTARRDLARAVYGTLDARLTLRYRAGVLSISDLKEVAEYFPRPLP